MGEREVDPTFPATSEAAVTDAWHRVPDTRWTVLPRLEHEGAEVRLVDDRRPRYARSEVVGEGGMGRVWRALDQDIARDVAIKTLQPEARRASSIARFVDEVRLVGGLEHPNIPPIHDVGVDEDGQPFFVMKYVEGQTLGDVLSELRNGSREAHRRWPMERRLEVVRGILQALRYAHRTGLVHRDVKPANVMVGRFGEVILMDWGIARPVDRVGPEPEGEGGSRSTSDSGARTAAGTIVGTPEYMSPEQARATGEADPRMDLYSVGVLLHELITLRHYLTGIDSLQALVLELYDPRDPPITKLERHHPAQREVPAELLHIAKKAIAKDPARRYQSADEMLSAIDDARQGLIRVQCHVTLLKRGLHAMLRFIDRHPILAPLWFLLAMAVVLGSIGLAVSSLLG